MNIPACPRCGSLNILLDSLCRFDAGEGIWVHDCDDGNYFCRDCEVGCTEEEVVWKPLEGS